MIFDTYNSQLSDVHYRFMQPEDYDKGIFSLLSELTKAPTPDRKEFLEFLQKMKNSNQTHINIVAQSLKDQRIIGFGSIIVCLGLKGKQGKIENIVTSEKVRGRGFGKIIIQLLKKIGMSQGCDKITLFCEPKNVKFYEKLGFVLQGSILACYK